MTKCDKCGENKQTSEVRNPDGTVEQWCCECWNRSVAMGSETIKVHSVKIVKAEFVPQYGLTFQAVCSCGWRGHAKSRNGANQDAGHHKKPPRHGLVGPKGAQ